MRPARVLRRSALGWAVFYRSLSRLLEAGMPIGQALATVAREERGAHRRVVARAAGAMARGNAMTLAARLAGLFPLPDYPLLQAGEEAGALPAVTAVLADRHEAAARRTRRLRSRMAFPAAVLALGLLVAPLPGLVSGAIGPGQALARIAVPLLVLGAAGAGAARLAARARAYGVPSWADAAAARMPLLSRLSRRRVRCLVLELTAAMAGAGLPVARALRIALATAGEPRLAAPLRRAALDLEAGRSVTEAFRAAGLLDSREALALVGAAEAAGRLDDVLGRLARLERGRLEDALDELARWVPRVAYALVAGWIAAGLVG